MKLFAGIEGGGTKFITIITNEKFELIDKIRVDTTTPEETLEKTCLFINKHNQNNEITAIGITCFGPIDLNRKSLSFGSIVNTPKPYWSNFPIYSYIKKRFKVPIDITTDVNGSALAEGYWGGGKDVKNFIYMTIGTGIGIGVIIDGKIAQGGSHFESGHMLIPHDTYKDNFNGICPFHGDCLEGLASGPALKERWHVKSALYLPPDHSAWDLEAEYISSALVNLILCYSPQKIILGGGVMKQTQLLHKIRKLTKDKMNNYTAPELEEENDKFIILQQLQDISGAFGATLLASNEFDKLK
jgi:fructokinase